MEGNLQRENCFDCPYAKSERCSDLTIGDYWGIEKYQPDILKSNNGSLDEEKGISAYFTHPYTSCEKGTNECHNKMLRRFVPKGKSIHEYSADDILFFADIINGLPRKILNYHTPEELFEKQLDLIYSSKVA